MELSLVGGESDTLNDPPSPIDWRDESSLSVTDNQPQTTIRRRKVRGYVIDTDDEMISGSEYEEEEEVTPCDTPCRDGDISYDPDTYEGDPFFDDPFAIQPLPDGVIQLGGTGCFSGARDAMLPQYSEKLVASPEMSRLERILASFTMYSELKAANETNSESSFERVFMRLQMEWTYVGGLVCSFRFHDLLASF